MKKFTKELGPGWITLVENDDYALSRLIFGDGLEVDCDEEETPLLKKGFQQIQEYWTGHRVIFTLPLAPGGSDFEREVWETVIRIPYGEHFTTPTLLAALALLLVVALPAAYCLSRFHFKGCKVLNTLFMAGLFINVNYIVVPIFLMLRDSDVWLKGHFGSGFLLNNLVVLAVVYAATALPFTIYLLSGYFATLPHDFEEAAYIDGASYFSTMTRIIFPMAKPSIITIILFNFLSFWNEYIISMTLMSSTKAPRTLPVGLLNLMQAQQSAAQYGTMYAGLVLVMLPTLILYICVQRQLTQGMTVGGLKG